MADPDPLHDLRTQVRATQEAAERLMGDAVPPRGWSAGGPAQDEAPFAEELRALSSLLATLRDVVPPELREQLNDLLRQVLLVLRALLDWWVAQLEHGAPAAGATGSAGGAGASRVEDIPIA
jgi:hypothetical protein